MRTKEEIQTELQESPSKQHAMHMLSVELLLDIRELLMKQRAQDLEDRTRHAPAKLPLYGTKVV